MSYFCNFSEAFDEQSNEELDKLARQVNNDKKRNKNFINQVQNDIIKDEENRKKVINSLIDSNKITPLPSNFNSFAPPEHNNYQNQTGTSLDSIYKQDDSCHQEENSFLSLSSKSNKSLSKLSDNMRSLQSSDIIKPKRKKYKNKDLIKKMEIKTDSDDSNFSDLQENIHITNIDIDSLSSDGVINHVKKCNKCRSKVNDYLNSHNNNEVKKTQKETSIQNIVNSMSESETDNGFLGKLQLKEIIVIILIGIAIILIIDAVFNKN